LGILPGVSSAGTRSPSKPAMAPLLEEAGFEGGGAIFKLRKNWEDVQVLIQKDLLPFVAIDCGEAYFSKR
jgi:hypothetical protein